MLLYGLGFEDSLLCQVSVGNELGLHLYKPCETLLDQGEDPAERVDRPTKMAPIGNQRVGS
jgi:hypothetical protein